MEFQERLMDILGNQNRRRILRLLAQKPCYVTEISETLKISPKAVLEHLEALESSGLVKCFYGEQKRKYYYVSRDLHLEIFLSPFSFEINFPENEETDLESLIGKLSKIAENSPESFDSIQERIRLIRSLLRDLSSLQRKLHSEFVKLIERAIIEVNERTVLDDEKIWR
ncbi:MAG: ArsR family transcriptional regulator [Archaeoglobi archaeon]|nr:ArsR family transcriptional regulator [Candidatus Mnemosynella bozhongmuii]